MSEQTEVEAERSPFNWTVVFFISLFLGIFGIDRFYVGKKKSGVVKLLTLGGLGIWWLVDLFIIASGKSTDASKKKIRNTSKQRVVSLISLIPLTIVLFAFFSSPEEREQRRAERELKKAEQEQKKAEREQKKQQEDNALNEENYVLGKKLFDEKKYDEALPVLKKIDRKHKEYDEIQNMIAFINEFLESVLVTAALASYVGGKDDLSVSGASGKEFQSILNAAGDKKNLTLIAVTVHYAKMAKHIEQAENLQKSEFKYLKPQEKNNVKKVLKEFTNQAKNKLKKEQQRDFPILRKEMAKIYAEKLWRNNIEVKASGNRNSRLEFISVIFANNANIEDFQNITFAGDAKEVIKIFRFKRVAYRWNKYDEEYTYYEYDTPSDDMPVNALGGGEK